MEKETNYATVHTISGKEAPVILFSGQMKNKSGKIGLMVVIHPIYEVLQHPAKEVMILS